MREKPRSLARDDFFFQGMVSEFIQRVLGKEREKRESFCPSSNERTRKTNRDREGVLSKKKTIHIVLSKT